MTHLLIVDDSKFNRGRVCAALKDDGYELTEFSNGKQVLDYLANHSVSAILTDLLMPEMDGFEILKALKEQGIQIPVVVLSADIQESSRQICTDLGAVGFVNKPFKPHELRTAVQQALSLTGQEC